MAMSTGKRTIILTRQDECIYDEATISGTPLPGYLVEMNSAGKVQAHSTRGGKSSRKFLREDSLQGKTYLQAYADGDLGQFYTCPQGVKVYGVLKVLENVAIGDFLISNGDGTVVKAASAVLVNNVADSTTITNVTAETTFSNGTITIPKNTLKVGDSIRIRGLVVFVATNSTDTAQIKVKLGSTSIVDTGAIDNANADVCQFDITLVVRTIGATGTIVGQATYSDGVLGTATTRTAVLASTSIDTTAAITITVTQTTSVANAGNQSVLRMLIAEQVKMGTAAGAGSSGGDIIGKVTVAKDLSAASADANVEFEVM